MIAISNIISLAAIADSTNCDPNNVINRVCNPLAVAKVADLEGLVSKLLNDFGGIIGFLAILLVVYSGFQMIIANGDKGKIDSAKATLKYGIYGFLVSIMAYTIIVALENFIGVQDINKDQTQLQDPLKNFKNFKVFSEHILQNTLLIIGTVSMLMIIVNGFKYMSARGNQAQVDDAKRAITWAVVGVLLSLLAFTIVKALAGLVS